MAKTRAITGLEQLGVVFGEHRYEVPTDADTSYGEAVAAVLGVEPTRVYKTLVAEVDGEPVVGIVPVTESLSLKALARARGGKRAAMADPADAERLTGYVTGGISPFGQRRRLPVVVDETARGWDTVFVSGGRRGLQLEVRPDDLIAVTDAAVAPIGA
jgi:Cys-tRNA(Pro)/Cys-tRNA(Cys) deacylase